MADSGKVMPPHLTIYHGFSHKEGTTFSFFFCVTTRMHLTLNSTHMWLFWLLSVRHDHCGEKITSSTGIIFLCGVTALYTVCISLQA